MYWIEYDWFMDSDTIWCADLNGQNQQVLVEGNISDGLFSLVVDNASDKIYWLKYEYETGLFVGLRTPTDKTNKRFSQGMVFSYYYGILSWTVLVEKFFGRHPKI